MPTQPTARPASTPSALAYSLVFTDAGAEKRHALIPGATVIGRAGTCDVVLNDASVSRWHVRLTVGDGQCVVKDIGSRNGTYLNGDQIEEAALRDGDHLVLGQVALTVHCTASDQIVLTEGDDLPNVGNVVVRQAVDADLPVANVAIDAPRLLKLLSDISRTLVGTLPIDEVLAQVVDLAFDCTRAMRVLLLLSDETTGELVPRVVRHREGTGGSTMLSRTILNQVLRDRVSMLAMNAQIDPRLDSSQSMVSLDIRSFMCAPLWHENEIIGLLYVDNAKTDRFTPADLDLFTAFSNYAAVAIAQARLAARVLEETKRRERLSRYHSPAVVERILKGGTEADAPFIAQERDLTVLFADLVGFTSLAENLPPQQVAVLLNVFFGRMADAIFLHEGTLDKFIGDSVLAVFGAPLDLPNHALNAVRAAQSMHRALATLNEERPEPVLRMRIAIHTGVAMVGDLGSPRRREYTVLGDVVNTAARIEDSAAGPGQTVITRATFDRLEGRIPALPLGFTQFRGQTKQVELFEVPTDA